MDVLTANTDGIFGAISMRSSNQQALSSSAISRGAQRLQAQDLDGALVEFQRAAAYDPSLTVAFQYQARVYSMMGKSGESIAAYQRALRSDPTNPDVRNELAGAYLKAQRTNDAEAEYKRLAQGNPSDPGPVSSLGYLYLSQGRLAEADTQFSLLTRLSPKDSTAFQALGQLRNQQGRYAEAVKIFGRALELDPRNADAMSELGYAYVGLDDTDKAQQQADQLRQLGTDRSSALATELELTMFKPAIAYLDPSQSTFRSTLGPGTALSTLDPALATPGASAMFSMTFRFNQPMDLASVQNQFNWSIGKATGGTAGVYNHGANLHPDQEVNIAPFPFSVRYNPDEQTATVYFQLRQNDAGNGVIDPSHWVFSFGGKDVSGNPMDPRGDQYSGFAGGPF